MKIKMLAVSVLALSVATAVWASKEEPAKPAEAAAPAAAPAGDKK